MHPRAFPSLRRRTWLALAAATLASPWALAQDKPLRLVVAGPAGGNADLVARIVAEPLARELDRPVIVDPKPGAAGAIAVGELLQAPPDGNTLLVGVNSLVSEIPHIVKLRWQMDQALRPVAELARGGLVLVAHPSVPASTVPQLVAYAKEHPGKLSYASYSPGTMSHVLGAILNRAAGIELLHVGYKGSTPALADVMGNHVPLMFDGLPTSLPLVRSGKLKALAVSAPQRVAQLPDVPTFREAGYPQLEAVAWMGLWTAPQVPAATQARLRAATLKALAERGLRARMLETKLEAGLPRGVDAMARELRTDYERVGAVLKSVGFRPE
ncbi:MAG TPA: tripartite tricarboxylate transporter substrate binding protein [Ramlibacter sp.]|uniref:tripartite tricarboxylate transporter substrate binding protein n=1 Tax=Ramlibacter sp. TaxID=1917967 RepID=UPI002D7EB29F|nr:tripartite tricarboxylate transporter substrate binding protein [Ramlibacter sp.]HET8745901.1 tripartite tricarboxylate transporter substrate binding protein [Ramlibacter sp.]